MSLVFLTNSLLTTVQDLGRNKFRRFGINPNGAMDKTAARLVNILLGNDENEAVLEMHFPAPKILFEENAIISLGGAKFGARINEREIENWRPVLVEKGSVLSFSQKIFGNRAYLSVKGGFQIEKWLGSGSTNLRAAIGGFQGKSLIKDDKLFFKQRSKIEDQKSNLKISRSLIPHYSLFPTVRFVPGAEFEKLTDESKIKFQTENFTIRNESDRMGFRLQGESLNLKESLELVSSAVSFGTVQLLPDGQLIILMADHQTTGGYPRLAHIISRDLPLAAQLGAGDKLNFTPVSIEDAENLTIEFEKDLILLKTACRFLC
jgi:antagonist of KipI